MYVIKVLTVVCDKSTDFVCDKSTNVLTVLCNKSTDCCMWLKY